MKAPLKPGKYSAYFRFSCPFNDKIPFGSRLWCEIQVPSPQEDEFLYKEQLQNLLSMGFDEEKCKIVLIASEGNLEIAIEQLCQ